MHFERKAHPVVTAFTDLLKNGGEKASSLSKRSPNLHKVSQVLGWRNRFSQSEYYPIELSLTNAYNGTSSIKFKVKQVQRGEVENTYGTGGYQLNAINAY